MSVHSKVTRLVVHPGLTDRTLSPVRYGQEVAQRGLHGLYLPEHTHMPVAYEPSDYPQDAELPDRYKRLLDPYIALAFVAATTDIEIGTCVSLAGQHDPIVLAKQAATLNLLAGGDSRSVSASNGAPASSPVTARPAHWMSRGSWCSRIRTRPRYRPATSGQSAWDWMRSSCTLRIVRLTWRCRCSTRPPRHSPTRRPQTDHTLLNL